MMLLSWPLCYLALVCLLLAMPRSIKTWRKHYKPSMTKIIALRIIAAGLILTCLILNSVLMSWGMAIVVTLAWLTLSHLLLSLLYSFWPRWALLGGYALLITEGLKSERL